LNINSTQNLDIESVSFPFSEDSLEVVASLLGA
jgi:hypothetical protein